MPRRSRSAAWAASSWVLQRRRISPWVAVGKTTSLDWMRASSSSAVRGELPRRRGSATSPGFSTARRRGSRPGYGPRRDRCADARRAHAELVLLDAKSGFGFDQLDIGLPELVLAP